MAKNIIVFSDGTGQEGGVDNNTNIYKLFNMIEDRTDKQVVYYDAGLGTGCNKLGGLVGGAGMSRNIRQCYRFIFENFEAGDQIFLFGFSRGAATVRSLSSFIHYFGILPKSRPELIKRAYKIYKTSNADKRKARADAFVSRHHTMWTRIRFLGCYDTVAALGLPFKAASALLDGLPGFRHKFHNFTLSESVEDAFHALAIDDERKVFHPVLWDREKKNYQTIKQVWFCGMHTDAGGGYKQQGLAGIPLTWLTGYAVNCGLRIYNKHKVLIKESADGHMHNSRAGIGRLYRRKQRDWDAVKLGRPVIHESVLRRKRNQNNNKAPAYKPWIIDYDYEVEPWVKYQDQSWFVDNNVK